MIWSTEMLFAIGGLILLWAAHYLFMAAERLLEECQMMRTARSAASQCPLQGKVVVKGGGA